MNGTQRGILMLLKAAVTGEKQDLPEGFSLEEAMPVIQKHHAQSLSYEGAMHCGLSLALPQMKQLLHSFCRYMLVSEKQMNAVMRVREAFEDQGIDHMLLKGCNMKRLYPRPELRVMGDADILIRAGQYDRIRPVMEALGFSEETESNHEYIWKSDDLYLELHKSVIPSYNEDYYAWFGNGWDLAVKATAHCYRMSCEHEFVYLFTHFAKHFRDGGIGIRHVLDLWVYRRAYPNMDFQYIEAVMQKLRLKEFYNNICRLLEVWFGEGQTDEKLELMTGFVFDSGTWGRRESHVLSSELRNKIAAGSAQGGRLRSFRQAVFPSARNMSQRYQVLEKAPWLLPVMWPVRWADALLFRRERVVQKHRELKHATDQRVAEYQQFLKDVGLDFRFGE